MAPAMRTPILVVLLMSAPALANTGSHSGGGGGGSSAHCIRWEPIPYDLGGRDMTVVDGGALDGGTLDGGTLDGGTPLDMGGHAGMRCAEYASLFSCAVGGGTSANGALPFVVLALALLRRRRRAWD